MKQKHKINFEKIQEYQINARHYYENSRETLQKKEFGKAGELLWGAIAEIVKAISLKDTDYPINSHNQIRSFMSQLSSI